MTDVLAIRRAAGSALRAVRRRGAAPGRPVLEPLPPQLAIEALLSAMAAQFGLAAGAVDRLLRPALADWRDAVGCADPLLVPKNAASEPQLIPLPLPSWCASLVDAGLLTCEEAPRIDGPRVVLRASLAVVREVELAAVERFLVTFAGRFASGPASPAVHLAISPPYLASRWRGPICIRAGASRSGKPPRIWVGAPASPARPLQGESGEGVATWVADGQSDAPGWPARFPRWLLLRLLEAHEPQALWHLPALWAARSGDAPEAQCAGTDGAKVAMRLGVDLGSTSTAIVEEDSALAGAPGRKLLAGAGPRPSGFRLLAGDPGTAHRHGCSEHLLAPGGQLPTALAAGSAEALARVLAGDRAARHQLWLPQAGADPAPVLADRFKSPELLLLSEWLAALPGSAELNPQDVSRTLLETYGQLLGLTLAAAHQLPLVTAEAGRWALRWPRLQHIEAVLTFPQCPWSASDPRPFREVFDGIGRELCEGLGAAWSEASSRLVADPLAARKAQGEPRAPIEVLADFGGLTLQVSVRLPRAPGRLPPSIGGSSVAYLLGGERLLDAAAYAAGDLRARETLRDAFRASARKWRSAIAHGDDLSREDPAAAQAIREAVLAVVLPLVGRQLEATLRRAAPAESTLRGARVRLYLLGEGWKLVALDAPDAQREAAALRILGERPLFDGARVELARIDKRRLCEGALRAGEPDAAAEEAVEVQGVDVGSPQALAQRWFAVAAPPSRPVSPLAGDPWWQQFAGVPGALLRVEQWFSAPKAFAEGLPGGAVACDASRSVLKQWLDVSGPSLLALRVHAALQRHGGAAG